MKASGASDLKISRSLRDLPLAAEPARDFGGFVPLPREKQHNLVNIMGWDYTFRPERWKKRWKNGQNPTKRYQLQMVTPTDPQVNHAAKV